MKEKKNTIIITLNHEGRSFKIPAHPEQYESLMCLISEHIPIRRFGICYGGGCCGTCGVEISDKVNGTRRFILSCEVRIDDDIANKTVSIL